MTKAITFSPGNAAALRNRGIAYGRSGEMGKAIEDFNAAIEVDPDYAAAYYSRGFAYKEIGKYEQAVADYKRYLELAPNAPDREEVIIQLEKLKSKLGR